MADTAWTFPLVETTQNASTARSAVVRPASYRLIGVDGAMDGPLRPFPGFIEVHRFRPSLWGPNHNTTSEVLDTFPINFVVGDDGYAYGFVYRVRRKSGAALCDVFIDYFNSKLGEWVISEPVLSGCAVSPDVDPKDGRQMSVSVVGRMVYIFVQDQEPCAVTAMRETPYTTQVYTNTGPGSRPLLISPRNSTALGDITDTDGANRPGRGQVRLLDFLPSDTGLLTYSGTGSVGSSGTGFGQDESKIRKLKAGDYAFAFVLYNSKNGRRSAISEIAEARKDDFDPDGSGSLAPTELYAAIEICYDTTLYDQAYIYRSVRVQDAGGTYVAGIYHLDAIIDLAEYHTTNNPLANPDLAQAVYWYELDDKQLVAQPQFLDATRFDENMPKGGASLWYENTLFVSSIRLSSLSTEEENRKDDAARGVGELRWSSLTDLSPELFPPENRYYPEIPANDITVLRTAEPNAIGFSKDRQYHVRKESVYLKVQPMHKGFGAVNYKAAESVGSYVYFLSLKGLMAVDARGQLDAVRSMNEIAGRDWASSLDKVSLAFDPLMSALFVYNQTAGEAVVYWMNTAKVTMVQDLPFRQVCRGVWPETFTFDKDEYFGDAGRDNGDYYNPLVERAFFVDASPKEAVDEGVTAYEFRVFQVDTRRERSRFTGRAAGYAQRSLLPSEGDHIFTLNVDFPSGTTLGVDLTDGSELGESLWGCRVYVLDAGDKSMIGRVAVVKNSLAGVGMRITTGTAPQLHGLERGDVVGVSPVYFEWQGSPVGAENEENVLMASPFECFRTKTVSSLQCAFSDVGGAVVDESYAPTLARFRARVYKGNEDEPSAQGDTVDGQGAFVRSVVDREGQHAAALTSGLTEGKYGVAGATLTPGVVIFCPELDFRLLGVRVVGDVRQSTRSERS